MQPRFKLAVLSLNIDLHVFTDPDAAHLRHPKVPHRIAHGIPLRIEHRCFWHHNHFCLHRFTISAEGRIRPERLCRRRRRQAQSMRWRVPLRIYYFKRTISISPSRRSTLTPTSPSSCLVSRRSTRAPPTFKSRIVTCGRNGGKSGFENTSFRSGAEMLKPRHASNEEHRTGRPCLRRASYGIERGRFTRPPREPAK